MMVMHRRRRRLGEDPLLEELTGAIVDLRDATMELKVATDRVRSTTIAMVEEGSLPDEQHRPPA